jgi:hypothetical protein
VPCRLELTALKMEAVCCSELLVSVYQSKLRHVPHDNDIQIFDVSIVVDNVDRNFKNLPSLNGTCIVHVLVYRCEVCTVDKLYVVLMQRIRKDFSVLLCITLKGHDIRKYCSKQVCETFG